MSIFLEVMVLTFVLFFFPPLVQQPSSLPQTRNCARSFRGLTGKYRWATR